MLLDEEDVHLISRIIPCNFNIGHEDHNVGKFLGYVLVVSNKKMDQFKARSQHNRQVFLKLDLIVE